MGASAMKVDSGVGPVSVKIDREQWEALRVLAAKNDRGITWELRLAIREHLERSERGSA